MCSEYLCWRNLHNARCISFALVRLDVRYMKKRFGNSPYYTAIPCLILFCAFCILPTLLNFYYALTDFNGVNVAGFIGLENFKEIIIRNKWPNAVRISLLIAVLVTVFQNLIAIAMSVLVSLKVKGSNFFRSLYFFPTAMGIFACATVWSILLDSNYGQVTSALNAIGINAQFWGTTKSVYVVIAIQIWMTFGYAMTIYYANIKSIPAEMLEAASIDGATLWQRIRYIILPSMLPSIRSNLLLSMVGALQLRDIIMLTTAGGPMESSMNLSMLIYEEAFSNSRYGLAAAYQIVHFIVIFICAIFVLAVLKIIERRNGNES